MSGPVLAATPVASAETPLSHGVSFGEAFRTWLRVAALSFGGPAGQIAVMHRILVEEKRWIGENRFLHALNYCMLLPGPEAQQLATYIGWLMHRHGGRDHGGWPLRAAWSRLDHGSQHHLRPVRKRRHRLGAVLRPEGCSARCRPAGGGQDRQQSAQNEVMIALAAIAFVAIFFCGVPFPIIVLAAGVVGFLGGRAGVAAFQVGGGHGAAQGGRRVADAEALLGEELPEHARPTVARALRVSAVCLALWLVPVAVILATLGSGNVFSQIAMFFSTMAVVTFGGAYAVLAYVAQQAVENYGWLRPGEMLDGLGMAETTPGPLIMVLQFVGFMGAFRDPGALSPLTAGMLGGLLATWVTFVPCFLFIFLGAPFIEVLRGNRALHGALSAITAAVVGVILNLAIWFAVHTIFRETWHVRGSGFSFDAPVVASVNVWALLLSIAAVIAMFRFKVAMIPTLAACSTAGLILYLVGAIS